jgi:predicted DNA-binding protein YlxM (UPF0122 family)
MSTIPKSKLDLVKNLYYDNGYSMNEISKKLNVSFNSVVYFMRQHHLKRRNFKEANKMIFDHKPLSFRIKTNLTEKEKELLIRAIMIY